MLSTNLLYLLFKIKPLIILNTIANMMKIKITKNNHKMNLFKKVMLKSMITINLPKILITTMEEQSMIKISNITIRDMTIKVMNNTDLINKMIIKLQKLTKAKATAQIKESQMPQDGDTIFNYKIYTFNQIIFLIHCYYLFYILNIDPFF